MKPLLTLLAAAVFALAPVAQAQSQTLSGSTSQSDVLWQLAAKQVVQSLDSDFTHVRAQTLKNAIVFSTLYRDKVELGIAVRSIARVAKNDQSDQNRKLAVAALQAIGSFRAKQHLAELQGIDDEDYRLLVADVINEYYTKPNAL